MTAAHSVNRRLIGGAFGGLIFTTVNVLVAILQLSILLRHLTLEMAGIWMVFLNLGSYALILDLGLSPTLGREISFAAGDPAMTDTARESRIAMLVRSCTVLVAVLAIIVAGLGGVGGWGYLHTIAPARMASNIRSAWCVFMLGAALNLVGQGWFAGIYGLGYVLHEKLIRSAGAALGLIFLTIAVYTRTGFMGLALAYLLQAICLVAMARAMLSHLAPYAIHKGGSDWRAMRELIAPSLKYAAMMLGGVLILQTDNIVIASVLGPAAVPNYQATAKVVAVLMSLSMMLVVSSTPILSQAHARGDSPAMVRLLFRSLRFTLGVMVILGSFIACFMDRITAVWLGPNHFIGFPIVWVLLIVMLLEAHHQAMAASTMAAGHIVFLVPALIAGLLNICFSVVLARHLGLIGVALGTMIAQVTTNNWYAPYYTLRLFKISFGQHLRKILLPVFLLAILTLGEQFSIRILTAGFSEIVSICVGGVSTFVLGALSFSLLMVTRQEQSALLKRLRILAWRWTALHSSDLPM